MLRRNALLGWIIGLLLAIAMVTVYLPPHSYVVAFVFGIVGSGVGMVAAVMLTVIHLGQRQNHMGRPR